MSNNSITHTQNNNLANYNRTPRDAFNIISQRAFDVLQQSARLFRGLFNRMVSIGTATTHINILNSIPSEVWRNHIFPCLSKRDIQSLAACSRNAREAASTYHYRKITIDGKYTHRFYNSNDDNDNFNRTIDTVTAQLKLILEEVIQRNERLEIEFINEDHKTEHNHPNIDTDWYLRNFVIAIKLFDELSIHSRIVALKMAKNILVTNDHVDLITKLLQKTTNLELLILPTMVMRDSSLWSTLDLSQCSFQKLEILVFNRMLHVSNVRLPQRLMSVRKISFNKFIRDLHIDLSNSQMSNIECVNYPRMKANSTIVMPRNNKLGFIHNYIRPLLLQVSMAKISTLYSLIATALSSIGNSLQAFRNTLTRLLSDNIPNSEYTPIIATFILIVSFSLYQLHQFYMFLQTTQDQ